MAFSVKVESQNMFKRFLRLDAELQERAKDVVSKYTKLAASDIRKLLDKPLSFTYGDKKLDAKIRKGKASGLGRPDWQRSKPGQPPRKDTGRYQRSISVRFSPKRWVGVVSTSQLASDKKGRRYPWMLESGSKHYAKRPVFKRVQRKLSKPFRREFLITIRGLIRGSIYR